MIFSFAWVKDLKGVRRGRIEEYVERFKGAEYHEGKRPWVVNCDLALPCATQNELNGADARTLVSNGCIAVSEGANMPKGIHDRCVEYGTTPGDEHIDYVRGANIGGFVKVADAMLAFGVV